MATSILEHPKYGKDVKALKRLYRNISTHWDGKECILELKEADFQWRQMEWWAFYFEFVSAKLLNKAFAIPGDRYGNVVFDAKGTINWDFKASAIKTNNHSVILNDVEAMNYSIEQDGYHGEIIALCDVDYNDVNRTFQQWHSELKGGKSKYEKQRESRTSISRYRKTKATVCEILFIVFEKDNVEFLSTMKQGRNSNGAPRSPKYMLDLESVENFPHYILKV